MIESYLQPLPHGVCLSCRAAGERGRPVLLFLHGFPEGAFVWDHFLDHFSQARHGGYRCVAPHLRGFEQSSAPMQPSAYRPKHLVQDIAALIALETADQDGTLAALVAHDWGGAVAWNLANQLPHLTRRLMIVNSPHPGTFLRELQRNPAQQAASAYMNFLIRPDAERLLAQDDYRRLWAFFSGPGETAAPSWLTDAVKDQYRAVWRFGLTGGCNLYRASPLRPPTPDDPAAAAVSLPDAMLTIDLPTLVVWAMDDIALPPVLLDGLAHYVRQLTLHTIEHATHWVLHEQPALVTRYLQDFLLSD
jgi:pimeloyl-ACP methyl ester carboxylesterase